MKKRKLLKSIVAMIALTAMLTENTFSVLASVTSESIVKADETVLTADTPSEDEAVSGDSSQDTLLTEDKGSNVLTADDDPDREIDISIGEEQKEGGEALSSEASIDTYDDKIMVRGSKDVTLYVNTDRMLASDSYELQISGSADLEYSSDLKGTLSKDSSGVYHIDGLDLKTVTFKAAALSNGMSVEYAVRTDGNPQITLISKDAPVADKKLRITDNGFEVKGSGYEALTLKLDATSLPGPASYDLYIRTEANVKCNGDYVDDGVIKSLIAEETTLRLSGLDYEAFTIYVKGSSSDRIAARYSIDSEENGVISAVVSEGDEAVDVIHEDEEDADEDEEEGKNEKREYDYEDGDVYVTAVLEDPEAIPDDAEFVVTRITPDSDQYNYDAYMQALNDNAEEITGEEGAVISDSDVLLYDVAFYVIDEDGNRVELQPEAGTVSISIRFKKDQLKDELGAETAEDVKTVHLPLVDSVKEDVNTTAEATDISAFDIKVEVVADSTSVEGEKVAFTLSDFSAVAVFVNGKMAPGPDETFKTILGNACVHGVVANYLNASGHFETNFAAGTLDGGANVATCKNDSNNAGVTYIGEYVGSGFFMDPNGNSSPAVVYTTEDALKNMHESMQKRTREGVIIDSTTYSKEQIQSRVASLVSKVDAKSEALADIAAYEFSSVANGNLLDIASKGSGAGTYYVNFAEGEYAEAAKNGLSINLAEGQKVVLTIPDTDVVFTQITVNGHAAGGTTKEDAICQSVVLNCPKAETAKTGGSVAAVVLVPKADFTNGTVSAGWLVANNVIGFSSEWHCVWHDMPPASECSTTIEAEKTVDFDTPTADQKFWFDLYSYDWNTKKTTLIQSVQNNGRKVIFDPFYYKEEGVYSYVLKERMENDAFAHDPNEYTIHIKVRMNKDLNQYEIYEKNIYKKNTLTKEDFGCVGHEDDGTVIKFNNQTTPRVPFDFTISKLFYQNDGTDWEHKRLIDEDVFKDYGFGNDWPDGASFTFDLERFDGKPTNSGIRMDSPLPQKTTITLTKDNRKDSFGKVFFDADTNDKNYGGWEISWDKELGSWKFSKIYMYKITERIPDDAHKIPGVVYTKRPVYVKLFVETYWQGESAKIRVLGRASYVNDNAIAGQECFPVSESDLEFVNAYYSGSLKVKKNAVDIDGKKADSDKDFYAVVYRKSGNNRIYYSKDGKENLYPVAEAVKGNSEIQFEPLPLGYVYYVYESDADGNQITGSKVYEVSYEGLSKDGTVKIDLANMHKEVTINNKRKPGSLKLIKSDPEKAKRLSGAEFELYRDGNLYNAANAPYTTDANGEIFVDKLPWGTYRFKEVKAPEGYELPAGDAAWTVSKKIDETTVSETVTIDADNDEIHGDMLLHKVKKEGDELNPLAGATFRLYSSDEVNNKESSVLTSGSDGNYKYDENGSFQELATDDDGNLSVTGLPYGTYRIYEDKAPKGFLRIEGARKFAITGDPATVEIEFINTKIKADVEFIKVGPNDVPLDGIDFELFMKSENGDDISLGTVTSLKDGHVRVEGLGEGEYYFEEKQNSAFIGTDADLSFSVTAADNGNTITLPNVYESPDEYKMKDGLTLVANKPVLGKAELFKYEMKDGVKTGLADAEFDLYKDGTKINKDPLKTGADGFIRVKDLEWGSYFFRETKAPTGFKPNTDNIDKNIKGDPFVISRTSLDFTGAGRLELKNTPITGYVELIKEDSEDNQKKLNGVVFELWRGTPDNPVNKIGEFDTVNGMISKDRIGELEYGNYFFKETKTIDGYKLLESPIAFAITEQDVLKSITAKNDRLPGKVVLEKRNSDHSKTLDGAEFELVKEPEGFIEKAADFIGLNNGKKYITENGGLITVDNLKWGKYYFKETKAPEGYVCDPTKKYEFTIKEDDLEANLTYDYGRDVVNEEETGAIKLIKDDGEGGNLDGAEFELYKDGVRYPDDIKTYVTGKDGAAGEIFIDNLPWGTYYFVEIKAPEGYVQPKEGDEWAKTSSVTIDKKSTISTVPFHQIEQSNTPIYGTLKLKKIDENGDALKGAKFSLVKIVDGEEKKVKVTGSNGVYAYSKTAGLFPISDDLETDNNATLVVTGLPYGYYEVHETQAPEGYNELEGAIYGFNVSEKDEEKNVEIANTPVQAKLRFIKASIAGARLDGAKFDLFRKSDNGWEPMGVMTSVDGVVFRDGLRPGEYYFEETESPTGYLINSKQYTFTVRDIDDGQFVTIDNPDDLTEEELLVLDPPMKGSVRLFKAIKGTDTGLKGAEFELYRSGENDPFLTGLESNDKGYVTVENLDWGTYFFKETKAPEGYILDDKTEYGFEINENNVSEVVTVNLKGEELRVDNTPILGEAELIKQDSVSDSPIEGAKFKLCYANGTTVEGYDLMSTGKDGVIRTSRDALKAGSYYFQEVEPAKGYKPNDTKYAFEINQANMDDYVKAGEDGIVLNTPIPGKAELYKYTKIDEENDKGIAGAQFKLYIKKTGFHPITPYEEYTDEVYTTKADGLIEVDGLKWGEYYFEEIAAPEGYILDEDVENRRHAFKIDAEKLDHIGDYKLSHENKPYKGSVGLIKKYAIGGVVQGPLPGARFSFYKVHDDTDDEPILNSATADGLYVTDENGSITITDLEWGEYYFYEEEAPEGYAMPKERKSAILTINAKNVFKSIKEPVTDTVINNKIYGNVELIKTDDKTPVSYIAGAQFKLYREDGTQVYVTDEVHKAGEGTTYAYSAAATETVIETPDEGKIIVTGLPYGRYYFKETKAPKDYQINPDRFEFSIKTDQPKDETPQVTLTCENSTVYANVEFLKVTDSIEYPLEGVVFELYKEVEGQDDAYICEEISDANGYVSHKGLTVGKYYFLEVSVPDDAYQIPVDHKFTFEIRPEHMNKTVTIDNVEVYKSNPDGEVGVVFNPPIPGEVKLYKVVNGNEQAVLKGAKFDLYKDGSSTPLIKDLETNDEGFIYKKGLEWGSYYFKETWAPEGYEFDPEKTYPFTISGKDIKDVKVLYANNTPIPGSMDLEKIDSVDKKPLDGVTFILYKDYVDEKNKGTAVATLITKNGRASVSGLEWGKYALVEQESEATRNLVVDPTPRFFEISASNLSKSFTGGEAIKNDEIKGYLHLRKLDGDTKKPMKDVQFRLFKGKMPEGKYQDTYTTNDSGVLVDKDGNDRIGPLYYGDYYLEEITPEGYEPYEGDLSFSIKTDGQDVYFTDKRTVYNTPEHGTVILKKVEEGTLKPLSGAKFTLYSDEPKTLKQIVVTLINGVYECGTYETNGQGEIRVTDLPWGNYYFKEAEAPKGHAKLPNDTIFKFTIDEKNANAVVNIGSISNPPIPGILELIKKDAETGKELEGAEFKLYQVAEGEDLDVSAQYGATGGVFSTDKDGVITVTDVAWGTYYFLETKAPDDYEPISETNVIKSDLMTINADNVYESGKVSQTVTVYNKKGYGHVSLKKEFQVLEGKDPVLKLSGVRFELYNDTKGDIVGTFETDENGMITADKIGRLTYGDYHFKEISVPSDISYSVSEMPLNFSITKSNPVNDPIAFTFTNSEVRATAGFVKIDPFTSERIAGVKFDVYREGSTVPVTSVVSDAKGEVLAKHLPMGKYYFKEDIDSAAKLGYSASKDDIFTFEITDEYVVETGKDEERVPVFKNGNEEMKAIEVPNLRMEGCIELVKLGKSVSGTKKLSVKDAQFELYKDGEKYLSAEEVAGYIKDDRVVITDLPWGTYYFKEIKAPKGYALPPEGADITTKAIIDGTTVSASLTSPLICQMTDDTIKVYISKREVGGSEELAGASMELYEADDKGVKTGRPVASWISGTTAKLIEIGNGSDGVVQGKSYVIHEDLAPVGFALAKDIVFTVNEDGSVKTDAGVRVIGSGNGMLIIMEDAPVSVSISKKDLKTDKELAGAVLCVMDGDNLVEQWPSTGVPHTLSAKIEPGKSYTLKEEKAPKGYYTAEPITFFIDSDGTLKISEDKSATAKSETVSTASGKALKLTMYDRPIQVEISKKRLSGGPEDYVMGAKLALYEAGGTTPIFTWISPKSGAVAIDPGLLEVGKKYKVVETEAPAGYVKADDLEFTVMDYNEFKKTDDTHMVTQSIEMFDKVVTAVISKKAITGEDELPAARLQVVDKNGKVMADFMSSKKQTLITSIASKEALSVQEKAAYSNYNVVYNVKLKTGESYTLKEISAPAGYALAKDIVFTINEKGVQSPSPAVMRDKPLEIMLSKKDIANGRYLEGAELELKNESNETVASWVSSDKPVLFSIRDIDETEATRYAEVKSILLPAGKYTLHEVKAPAGYALAPDLEIDIDGSCVRSDSGVIREESMYDYKEGTTNVYGDKIWREPKDEKGNVAGDYAYPEITMELYRDSATQGVMDKVPIRSIRLTNGTTSFAFGNLERFKSAGQDNYEYTYKVLEVMSDEAQKNYTMGELKMTKTEQGMQALYEVEVENILNQEEVKISGTKTFVLKKDKDGKISDEKYDDITIWLLQDGKRVDIDGDGNEESVTIANGAKETNGKAVFSFDGLPMYDLDTGNAYAYTVEETGADSYDSTVVYNGNEVNIFNTPKENPFYIKGVKVWIDPEGMKRPEITMQLFRDGVLYKETGLNDDYTFSFGPLYEYNLGWGNDEGDEKETADGHKFLYEVKEAGAAGYDVSIDNNGKDMVIIDGTADVKVTNRYKQEYVEKSGKKFWNDAGDSSRRPSVTINLYASDSTGRKDELVDTYVIPNTRSTYEFGTKGRKQLPKYDTNGKEIVYRVEEVAIPGYISVQNGDDFINTPSKVRISKLDATDRKELPGAVLSLAKKGEKAEVERWISGNTPHYIEGLEMGAEYTLTEVTAPRGYVVAQPVTFKVNTDGVEQRVEMLDDPIIGSVILTKLDSETREKLAGAVFNLYGPDGRPVKATGSTGDYTYSETSSGITEFVVAASGELKVDKLPYGAYYFKEVSAPAGYELGSETVSFTIADKDAAVTVSYVNTRKKGAVSLIKTNEDGSLNLAGAEFELYSATPRSAGQAAASTVFSDAYYRYGTYTTDSEGRIYVGDLPWDDYYFLETKAPDGYQINYDLTGDPLVYTFTINADNAGTTEISLGTITNTKTPEGGVLGERRPLAEKASGVLGVRSTPKKGVLGARVVPATGDVSAIALWLAVLAACIGTIVWLLVERKRKKA